jgi:hypothetical protein
MAISAMNAISRHPTIGEHHLGHVQRSGRVHHRGGKQVGQRRAEQRVADERRAGHRREAARHHREQLGTRETVEVRLDHQRRLGLAQEDHRGGVERLHLARAQQPGNRASADVDHPLDHPQVVEEPHERAQEDDHREHLKREDRLLLVGHETAEEEVDPVVRVLDQRRDLAGDEVERVASHRPAQDERGESHLDGQADHHGAPRDPAPVVRDEEGQRQDDCEAEQSAEVSHFGAVLPKCGHRQSSGRKGE